MLYLGARGRRMVVAGGSTEIWWPLIVHNVYDRICSNKVSMLGTIFFVGAEAHEHRHPTRHHSHQVLAYLRL